MKVLLDTSVISELYRGNTDQRVRDVIGRRRPEDVFLSVITVGELRKGIELLPASRKRSSLEEWLADLQHDFATRILPIDLETGHIWGEVTARARLRGEQIPAADGLIAATALRLGIRVMTRNTRHFEVSGALVVDPWRDDDVPGGQRSP